MAEDQKYKINEDLFDPNMQTQQANQNYVPQTWGQMASDMTTASAPSVSNPMAFGQTKYQSSPQNVGLPGQGDQRLVALTNQADANGLGMITDTTGNSDALATSTVNPQLLYTGKTQGAPQVGMMPSAYAPMLAPTKNPKQDLAGIADRMAAANNEAAAQKAYYDQLNKGNTEINDEYRQKIQDQNNRIQDTVNLIDQSTKDLREAGKVDPNRFWQNKSTGEKVTASIAIALGALGGAMNGTGKNLALDQIDKAIDKDIAEQERTYTQKKDSIAAGQTALANLQNGLQNMEASKLALKKEMLFAAENKLNNMMASVNSQEKIGTLKMMQAELQAKRANIDKELLNQMMESNAFNYAEGGQGFTSMGQIPQKLRDQSVKVGNEYKLATSAEARKRLETSLPAYKAQYSLGNELKDIIQKSSVAGRKLSPETKSRLNTIGAQITENIKTIGVLGTLDNGLLDFAKNIQGDPTAIFSSGSTASIEQYLKNLKEREDRELQQGIVGFRSARK